MDERRQLPRWEIKKEAKVLMQQTQGVSRCIIEDMNLKGMSVSFCERIAPQQAVRMSFAIGDKSDFIKIEVQIPWAKEVEGRYFYGLSFSNIADNDKEKIYQYTSSNCYDQFRKNWWEGVR